MIADHPRSRGVYAVHIAVQPPHWGSSPLARGLRSVFGGPSDRDGIIPARAGFTTGPHCTCLPPWDHPRSRGVYVCSEPAEVGGPGSSPLARGLRRRRSRSRRGSGIIPARAGFTAVSPASPWKCGDHPRSRGVYGDIKRYMEAARGSSPLARGLPGRPVCWCLCMRIIPARAGFTGTPSTLRLLWRDHPRSRGVYPDQSRTEIPLIGSSPLARGLQPAVTPAIPPRRIIPARAGFTGGWRSPARTSPDHPRSRGVYLLVAVIGGVGTGSSPLARGLPTFMGDMMSRPPDHPRSRGVYGGKAMSGSAATGSSPLARGLLRHTQRLG